jgi:hypothetical protein
LTALVQLAAALAEARAARDAGGWSRLAVQRGGARTVASFHGN